MIVVLIIVALVTTVFWLITEAGYSDLARENRALRKENWRLHWAAIDARHPGQDDSGTRGDTYREQLELDVLDALRRAERRRGQRREIVALPPVEGGDRR